MNVVEESRLLMCTSSDSVPRPHRNWRQRSSTLHFSTCFMGRRSPALGSEQLHYQRLFNHLLYLFSNTPTPKYETSSSLHLQCIPTSHPLSKTLDHVVSSYPITSTNGRLLPPPSSMLLTTTHHQYNKKTSGTLSINVHKTLTTFDITSLSPLSQERKFSIQ